MYHKVVSEVSRSCYAKLILTQAGVSDSVTGSMLTKIRRSRRFDTWWSGFGNWSPVSFILATKNTPAEFHRISLIFPTGLEEPPEDATTFCLLF